MGPSLTVIGIRSENDVGCNDLKVCGCAVCSGTVLGFESAFMTRDMKRARASKEYGARLSATGRLTWARLQVMPAAAVEVRACCTCGGMHLHTRPDSSGKHLQTPAVEVCICTPLLSCCQRVLKIVILHALGRVTLVPAHQGEAWSRAVR